MFTVKVREENAEGLSEVVYEAKQVMLQQGNVIIDLVEPDHFNSMQLTYSPAVGKVESYSGKIYVMNRYGATVATYDL